MGRIHPALDRNQPAWVIMNKKRLRPRILAALLAAGSLAAAGVYRVYRNDMHKIQARMSESSQIADTSCGPIEYATQGEGEAVLLVHATGGDFKQALLMGRMFVGEGFYFIAPSRPGYLRTPQSIDPSAAGQADVLACLLETLGVKQAAVLGMSAGGPVAMQFALRHPELTKALVLLSTAAYAPASPGSKRALPASDQVYKALFSSDFIFWAAVRLAGSTLEAAFGATPELQASLPPEEHADLDAMIEDMLPIRMHSTGLANDAVNAVISEPFPLQHIKAPTLVVQAADDTAAVPAGGKYTAEHIPGAILLWLESGGHVLLGHHVEIRERVQDFLKTAFTSDTKAGTRRGRSKAQKKPDI